jgi:N-acetyl-gamma-glutamyl-phosphate/LysW-gamma-L-alpha-aminoadipyl-6-phosphate reductase
MSEKKLKIAIFGGSGYGGAELLRILLFHPHAEIVLVTANEQAGKKVADVHRNLLGLTDLTFEAEPSSQSAMDDIDVAFLALPHGKAMGLVPELPYGMKIIDLSGDFRLADGAVFEKFYGLSHTAMDSQKDFVYGLSEINRESITTAERIANPGCFATAVLLALYPLFAEELVAGSPWVDAKTGSSGSGAKAAANTHHPERSNSFYAYKPFRHQHLPEIEQMLGKTGPGAGELTLTTHSLPVARGIFASCYLETADELSTSELRDVFEHFYSDSFFVRVVEGSPNINWVKMTNFCDISVHSDGKRVAVFSAIDNLVKGAAGQAVQNMNLMHGFDEYTGLVLAGSNP